MILNLSLTHSLTLNKFLLPWASECQVTSMIADSSDFLISSPLLSQASRGTISGTKGGKSQIHRYLIQSRWIRWEWWRKPEFQASSPRHERTTQCKGRVEYRHQARQPRQCQQRLPSIQCRGWGLWMFRLCPPTTYTPVLWRIPSCLITCSLGVTVNQGISEQSVRRTNLPYWDTQKKPSLFQMPGFQSWFLSIPNSASSTLPSVKHLLKFLLLVMRKS